MQRQLSALEGELETGRAILTSAMELLDDPKALDEEAKTPARKVLNKAIFTKLYIDDLGDEPTVAGDELKEPFATVVYARELRLVRSQTACGRQRWRSYGRQNAVPTRIPVVGSRTA